MDKNSTNKIHFRTSPVGAAGTRFRQKFALQKKNKAQKARFGTSRVAAWLNFGMAETGIFAGQRLDLYRRRNISRKDDGGCIHGQKAVQT
ncbi:MAG: hypothetical protein KHW46_05945 [Clostridiales bacterium]|nr:hypothetical protein [Clostridiales bacterium]